MIEDKDNIQEKYIFTSEQITVFVGYYHLLKRIHNRLISEGYILKDGKISKPESGANVQIIRKM